MPRARAKDETIVNQFNRQLNMRGLKSLRLVTHMALWASLGDGGDLAAHVVQPNSSRQAAAKWLYNEICEALGRHLSCRNHVSRSGKSFKVA